MTMLPKCVILGLLAYLGCVGASGRKTLLIGVLNEHEPTSWCQESFSQLKLAVSDINANTSILPGHILNYSVVNCGRNEAKALAGSEKLLDEGVVVIIGPSLTFEVAAPALLSSSRQTPIISPGSTGAELAVKQRFPYLMRVPNGGVTLLKAQCVFIHYCGWRHVAALTAITLETGVRSVMIPAADSLGISILMLTYPKDEAHKADLALVKKSGYRIIATYPYTDDLEGLATLREKHGLFTARYAWLAYANGHIQNWWLPTSQVFIPVARSSNTNAQRDAFFARWPSVSTRYNASKHGFFNKTSKAPFFDDLYSNVIWDTDYAQVGNLVPDPWGMLVYDTVWLFALAAHSMVRAGQSVSNGKRLLQELLNTTFAGITGEVAFDKQYQDRMQRISILVTQGPNKSPVNVATTTLKFSQVDAGMCTSGCIDVAKDIPWIGNKSPGDGSEVTASQSRAFSAPTVFAGEDLVIELLARNSFSQVPANLSSVALRILVEAVNAATGAPMIPSYPLQSHVADVATGSIQLRLPGGFHIKSKDDTTVTMNITLESERENFQGAPLSVQVISKACPKGEEVQERNLKGPFCRACHLGKYAPERGMTSCQLCPVGKVAHTIGASVCKSCGIGEFSRLTGRSVCQRCEQGAYSNQPGSSMCTKCPSTFTTFRSGAVSLSRSCVCGAGYFGPPASNLNSTCKACPWLRTSAVGAADVNGCGLSSAGGAVVVVLILVVIAGIGSLLLRWQKLLASLGLVKCDFPISVCSAATVRSFKLGDLWTLLKAVWANICKCLVVPWQILLRCSSTTQWRLLFGLCLWDILDQSAFMWFTASLDPGPLKFLCYITLFLGTGVTLALWIYILGMMLYKPKDGQWVQSVSLQYEWITAIADLVQLVLGAAVEFAQIEVPLLVKGLQYFTSLVDFGLKVGKACNDLGTPYIEEEQKESDVTPRRMISEI